MGTVTTSEAAGKIIRRVREDRGVSRAELSRQTGIGARTLYALETGGSENFGLGNYLKLLNALGLNMSIDIDAEKPQQQHQPCPSTRPYDPSHWNDLADVWTLEEPFT